MKKIILLLIFASLNIYAQNAEQQKLIFAKSFEQSGDFKTAARMYKELFDKYPQNREYFNGLVRTYKKLFNYSALKSFTSTHLKYDKSVETYNIFAEMLWRTGSVDSANSYWEKAIDLQPKLSSTYMTISNTQVELQLYSKAINTLKEGRDELAQDYIFSDDLCKLYIAVGNYKEGTIETMNLLKQTKKIALAQGRLSALMINNDANKYIKEVLQDELSSNKDNYYFYNIYAWFLRKIGDLEKAFEVTKVIDNILNAKGRQVLKFATDSRNDGDWDIALRAYEYLISMGKNTKFLSTALYGYSRTLEQKMIDENTFDKESSEEIIKSYKKIIEDYPDNIVSSDASLRIAQIYIGKLDDSETAIKELNKLIQKFPRTVNAAKALILLGNINIIENKLDDASHIFNKVVKNYEKISSEEILKAKYYLAEITFYKADFDSAQALYADLIKNNKSDVANDALDKIFLLEENKQYIKDMQTFSKALYLKKQEKYEDAIEIFKKLSNNSYSEDLSQRSLLNLSYDYYSISAYDSSIYYGKKLLENYPKSIYSEKVIMKIADNFIKLKKTSEAIKILSKLLVEYPKSIYLQKARDTIRLLRENKVF